MKATTAAYTAMELCTLQCKITHPSDHRWILLPQIFPVPGVDSVISVTKDSMNVGLGTDGHELEGQVECWLCIPMHCSVV